MRSTLIALLSVSAAVATQTVQFIKQKPATLFCASLNSTASAAQPDPTSIFAGGAGNEVTQPHSAMFLSSQYAYLVNVDDSGAMDVQQAPVGAFQSTAAAIGAYSDRKLPLIMHVIPTGSTDLHFLAINNSQLFDVVPPVSLASVLPPGFVPTAACVRHKMGTHYIDGLFFASADAVVSVCLDDVSRSVHRTALFNLSANFDNPLGVDETVDIQVDRKSERVFVLRRRSGSRPDDAGEVLVLRVSIHCALDVGHSIFVQPQPISIDVIAVYSRASAYVFWPMSPDLASQGRLFRWDLESTRPNGVANVSLSLDSGDVISPTGFSWMYSGAHATFWGMVVSQTPGDSHVVVTLVDAGDSGSGVAHHFDVACKTRMTMPLPTASATTGDQRVVFASDSGQFALAVAPIDQRSKRSLVEIETDRERNILSQCPSFTFGLPTSCAACSPPAAVCGLVEHCTSGCCFVSGGRVLCCTQSPAGTTTNGFSCSK